MHNTDNVPETTGILLHITVNPFTKVGAIDIEHEKNLLLLHVTVIALTKGDTTENVAKALSFHLISVSTSRIGALSWRGGLCVCMTLRAMSSGVETAGRVTQAGQVEG